MRRPQVQQGLETEALADDAGTRAMVDLMLGTTALLLVILLGVGAQAMHKTSAADAEQAESTARLDALFAEADGPVIFAAADGIRIAGSDRHLAISEIARSNRLGDLAQSGTPTLIIRPDGIEAAFHLTARLAALGVKQVRRVRLDSTCAAIEKVEIRQSGWSLSCRRR